MRKAIREGKIKVEKKCQFCGNHYGIVAHHRNYNLPTDVIWLCGGCHREEHLYINHIQKMERGKNKCRARNAHLAGVRSHITDLRSNRAFAVIVAENLRKTKEVERMDTIIVKVNAKTKYILFMKSEREGMDIGQYLLKRATMTKNKTNKK